MNASLMFSSVLLHAVPALAPPRHLVVFRARSRHTYGFDSTGTGHESVGDACAFASFDLPLLELASVLSTRTLRLTAADSAEDDGARPFWIDGVTQSELQGAAERCILVHGAYAVVSSAATVAGVRDELRDSGYVLPQQCSVDVIDLAQANLRRNERAELQAQLHTPSHGETYTKDLSKGDGRAWVLIREISGGVHLGWRVASGPAAGLGAPGLASGRRCYSGWLGKYALKNREFAAPTAMEPEIAFLSPCGGS